MDWQCPRCFSDLAAERVEGTELDVCPGCGGIWFNPGELARLAQGRPGVLAGLDSRHAPPPGARPPLELEGGLLCPVCRLAMREFEYPWAPGIRLDGCAHCQGVWVDDGELARIEAFVQRHRPGQAAPAAPPAPVRSAEPRAPAPPPAAPVPGSPEWQKQMLQRMQAAEDFFSRLKRR